MFRIKIESSEVQEERSVQFQSDHQEALKKLLLSQNGTQFAQLSLNSAAICYGKLRSSDLQLSRTLLVVTRLVFSTELESPESD